MKFWLIALALLAQLAAAQAQSVQQSGNVTPGHPARWVSNGVIGDAGTASSGSLTGVGVVASGAGICQNSAAITSAGWQRICLGATTAAGGFLSVQNFGTATAQPLTVLVNGTSVAFPSTAGTIPTITVPLVSGNLICASGTAGLLVGCTTGTNGQILVGLTSNVPAWVTASGDITSISTLGAVIVGKVNSVTFPASPSTGTVPFVSSSNTITYGTAPVTGGGTGAVTLTANGVLLGNGTSAVTAIAPVAAGQCLLSNGTGSAPSFQSCAAGSGSAGGSNTQVQFNNATSLAGSANLTWVTPALTIGVNATATGQLVLANGGGSGQSVTVQNPSTVSAYNFNLPIAAGTAGQPLLSGGGGSTAMTFGTLSMAAGGTGAAITGTSGGIPYFNSTTTMATSAALAANAIVLGGGAGTTPATTANATMSSGALTLGQVASVAGSVVLSGSTSGTATIRVAAAAGTATIFQLPANNGTSTQVLQTDGAGVTSWVAAAGGGTVTSVSASTGMSFSTITSSGSVAIDKASASNVYAGTSNKVLTSDIVYTAETTTTYGTTTTFDLNTFINTAVTLTGNISTVTVSNIKVGQCGNIRFIQDGTGSRTLPSPFNANFKFAGGTQPTLTPTASAVDVLPFCCSATNYCVASIINNVQ